jgi:hypothetical protein
MANNTGHGLISTTTEKLVTRCDKYGISGEDYEKNQWDSNIFTSR